MCSWTRHSHSASLLPTFMGTDEFNVWEYPAIAKHPIQGYIEILLDVALCYGNRDKLWQSLFAILCHCSMFRLVISNTCFVFNIIMQKYFRNFSDSYCPPPPKSPFHYNSLLLPLLSVKMRPPKKSFEQCKSRICYQDFTAHVECLEWLTFSRCLLYEISQSFQTLGVRWIRRWSCLGT